MKKILFIFHDASRTGAPILLLRLSDILAHTGNYKIDFILRRGGALMEEYKKRGAVNVLRKGKKSLLKRLYEKVSAVNKNESAAAQEISVLRNIEFSHYDFILVNTITLGDIVKEIRQRFKGPMISYIHELELSTLTYTTPDHAAFQINNSDHFLTPSDAVKKYLTHRFHVTPDKISYLPYYIPLAVKEKKLPTAETFVVGCAGTIDWRKGPDLFIQTAHDVYQARPEVNILFRWRGATPGIDLERLNFEIRKLGLQDKVFFEMQSEEMESFYQDLSVFLLTSREDPFPLVVLEAAVNSVPVICFKDCGGIPELVDRAQAGYLCDYFDITTMGNRVLYYYDHRDKLISDGIKLRDEVVRTHGDKENVINHFNEMISSTHDLIRK